MSGRALTWARKVKCDGGPTAKALLLLMADYANSKFTLFPSVATMAVELQLDERTVQRAMTALIEQDLVARESRFTDNGKRTSNVYRLMVPNPATAKGEVAQDPVTMPPLTPALRRAHPGTAPPSKEGTPTDNRECSDEHSQRGREAQVARYFEDVLDCWMKHFIPNSRTRPAEAKRAWQEVINSGIEPATLAVAARKALGSDPDFQRLGPPGLQRWLDDRRWIAWMSSRDTPSATSPIARFPDAAIRKAVVEAHGEDFAASYVDRADWDPIKRAITTQTGTAADKLRREARLTLRGLVEAIHEPNGIPLGEAAMGMSQANLEPRRPAPRRAHA